MIVKFKDKYLENLYSGAPLKGKPKYGDQLVVKFKKTVLILKNVQNALEISRFNSLNYEALKGNKAGLFSIRVDKGWRLEFRVKKEIIEIILIVELSKHYQ
jgi:toxin HigB-1